MTPRRTSYREKRYSRSFVVDSENFEYRQRFLEFSLPMLKDMDISLDERSNKITIEITGDYRQVNAVVDRLIELDKQLYSAYIPGKNDLYFYHSSLLTRLFVPPIPVRVYADVVEYRGYSIKLEDTGISSSADLSEFGQIHQLATPIIFQLEDLHRDIRRFVTVTAIQTEISDPDFILETAVANEILAAKEDGFHFSMPIDSAYTQLFDILSTVNIETVEPEEEDITIFRSSIFEGGKIVIVDKSDESDGERDRSAYDRELPEKYEETED